MRYTETTSSYNQRRYGKPWIARLDFTNPGKPEYSFGDWLGTPGNDGELSIEVEAGDVIATGQKDIRKNRGGADNVGVIHPDGTTLWYGTRFAAARDAGIKIRESLETETAPEIDMCALGM